MLVHDWTSEGGSLLVLPDARRVRIYTGIGIVAMMIPFALVSGYINVLLIPVSVAASAALLLITYVRLKHRRARISLDNEVVRVEQSTWAGAGRWVHAGDLARTEIRSVGLYRSGRTTRVVICRDGRPAEIVADIPLSAPRAEALAATLAERLEVPLETWTWRQLVSALG